MCQAEDAIRGDIWLIILLAYKGLLLLIGLFFAFETRKVKLRHINDTKLLGLSVVVFIVLGIALTAVGFLLEEFVDVYYGLIGIMILMGNFAVLCILFIPKVCVCVCVCVCACVRAHARVCALKKEGLAMVIPVAASLLQLRYCAFRVGHVMMTVTLISGDSKGFRLSQMETTVYFCTQVDSLIGMYTAHSV